MDLVSDVLRHLQVRGAVFFTARIRGRWAVASPRSDALARLIGIPAESLSLFHLIVQGSCQIAVGGTEPVVAPERSIVLLAGAAAHRLGTDLSREPVRLESAWYSLRGEDVPHLEQGRGVPVTRLVCGYLRCDQRFSPLAGVLPELLVERPADDWLAGTVGHAVQQAEAGRPGSAGVLPRLVEAMYVEVLRRYLQGRAPAANGWLAASHDPRIGQALRLLHADPSRRWRVDDLARAVGLSRSALGERFRSLVGQSPMRYLSAWRIQLAEELLQDSRLSVAQVAARVGFDAPVAFHRAFKRRLGMTPAQWRTRSDDAGRQ